MTPEEADEGPWSHPVATEVKRRFGDTEKRSRGYQEAISSGQGFVSSLCYPHKMGTHPTPDSGHCQAPNL